MVLTIRPPYSAILGSTSSWRWALSCERAFFVRAHEPAVTGHVAGPYCSQPAVNTVFRHPSPPETYVAGK